SFEVVVNDKLIYSKLQTMALPDYEEVADVIHQVSNGAEPREIKGQQPVNCSIS
ncbi:jg65, partial [Pararge aegeria aegeria]